VYVFLSRVLFFFFWLGLPYLGLLGVLILSPQQQPQNWKQQL
jgi:hypothetical protein